MEKDRIALKEKQAPNVSSACSNQCESLREVEYLSYRGRDFFHRGGVKAGNWPLEEKPVVYRPELIDQQV